MMAVKKPKTPNKPLKKLWRYLYYYKIKLVIALILTVVSNLLSLVGPFLSGRIVRAMTDGVDFKLVYQFATLMVIFYLTSAVLNYILSISMVRISQSVVYKMRKDVFAKLSSVPIGYYDENQTGDIISKNDL